MSGVALGCSQTEWGAYLDRLIARHFPGGHKLRRVGQQGLREFGGNHGKDLANYIPAIRNKMYNEKQNMYNEKQNV